MNIIYAHENESDIFAPSLFLAGPSPRNQTDYDWRPEALAILEKFKFRGNVFVPLPRHGEWSREYDEQIEWELEHLGRATVIAFWLPRDLETLPGFTTNVEFGMYVRARFPRSGKIVLGFPKDAPKMRYLEYLAKRNGAAIFHTLEATLASALFLLYSRTGNMT